MADATTLCSNEVQNMYMQQVSYKNFFSLFTLVLMDEMWPSADGRNGAVDMGKEFCGNEILSYPPNHIDTVQRSSLSIKEMALQQLQTSLDTTLAYSFQEHTARAFTNIIAKCVTSKEYRLASHFLQKGLHYCEERDLDSWATHKLLWKSRMLLETGDWNQAALIAKKLLNEEQPAIVKAGALINLAIIGMRRGEGDAETYLQEAMSIAFVTKEHRQIIPVLIACLEYEWLTAQRVADESALATGIDLMQELHPISLNSAFAFWLQKAGRGETAIPEWYEPYKYLTEGKPARAAAFWEKLPCPFEKAMALSQGNEHEKRNALAIFQQLGATAVSDRIKQDMRAAGSWKIPRGFKKSTLANPAQLTSREIDVIRLLKQGDQNKEIAQTLFISTRTVDNHISSILFKLDVHSRSKAVAEAMRLGIV